jgi:transcriptional regulator with PAS, ATPase and Fis domain
MAIVIGPQGEHAATGATGCAPAPDIVDVLSAVAAALAASSGGVDLHGVFEYEARRRVGAASLRLREVPARFQARLVTPTRSSESVVLGVPSADPRTQAVLEASFDAGRVPGPEDVELLTALAQLGGLVLEANRARAGLMSRRSDGAAPLIGSSRAMQDVRERVERVAATDFAVLIEGESGTGKELVARQIHELSRRRGGPFVAVNCAAIVETLLEAELFGIEERTATGVRGRRGKFEHADGGTLFLDEIGDLSMAAQAKLLRAIQDLSVERVGTTGTKAVNTRIVAATNRPLSEMVASGLFRADLYYRLSGVEIHVPPLRARREDIFELAIYFLARHREARDLALTDAARDALTMYAFPGNVRELERLIERAVALAETRRIELDDLPPQVRGEFAQVLGASVSLGESMRAWGSRYARLVFERTGRNKRRTCRLLDISYHTLQAYLRYSRDDAGPPTKCTPAWVHSVSERGAPGEPGP